MSFENTPGQGTKHDGGKIRMDLVPMAFVEAVAGVLTFGAGKYGDWNWAQGMPQTRLYGAALRHMAAWQQGEDTDPESGLPHLAHAACSLAMMITQAAEGIGTDDRHPFRKPSAPIKALVERIPTAVFPPSIPLPAEVHESEMSSPITSTRDIFAIEVQMPDDSWFRQQMAVLAELRLAEARLESLRREGWGAHALRIVTARVTTRADGTVVEGLWTVSRLVTPSSDAIADIG